MKNALEETVRELEKLKRTLNQRIYGIPYHSLRSLGFSDGQSCDYLNFVAEQENDGDNSTLLEGV